jgi:Tol biopolymer transport system component
VAEHRAPGAGRRWRAVRIGLIVVGLAVTGGVYVFHPPSREAPPEVRPVSFEPTEVAQMAFSRSGVLADTDVWKLTLDGKPAANLTHEQTRIESAPAFSPGGTRVAYAARDKFFQPSRIMLGDADTDTNAITVTDVVEKNGFVVYYDEPTFAPDGQLIAVTQVVARAPANEDAPPSAQNLRDRRRSILDMPQGAARGALEQLLDQQQPGSRIAIILNDNTDGPRQPLAVLDCGQPTCHDAAPNWSPDGSKIAFTRAAGTGSGDPVHIWTVNVNYKVRPPSFGAAADLSGRVHCLAEPAGPPAGTATASPSVPPTGPATASSPAGDPCAAAFQDGGPNWSSTSAAVVFSRFQGNSDRVLVVHRDGTPGPEIVGRGGPPGAFFFGMANPAWTPDRRHVVFSAFDSRERKNLYMVGVPAADDAPPVSEPPITLVNGGGANDEPAFRPIADLTATLEADPPTIPLGGTSVVKLTVANDGTHAARAAIADLSMPADVVIVTPPPKSVCPPPGLHCIYADMPPGTEVSVTLTVRGTALGARPIDAVARANRVDPDHTNDRPHKVLTVTTRPDVAVKVRVSPVPAPVGGPPVEVIYVVTNKGDFPATDVRLEPKLPALLPVLSAEPANLCTATPPACLIGDLPPGASAEVTFRLRPDLPKDTQVSGTVTAADDSNADNNTDSTAFKLIPPDLTLAVAVDKTPAPVGGPPVAVTYTVSNDGQFPARDVKLAASLPARLPVDSTEPAGACRTLAPAPGPTRRPAPGTPAAAPPEPPIDNICALGGLDPGQKATVTFRLRPDVPLDTVLTGEVTGNVEDATPANNRASHSLRLVAPDTALSIAVAPQPAYVDGDPVVVTYTVTNKGQFPATGVRVAVGLPDKATVVSAVPSAGTCAPAPAPVCTVGELAPGGTATITVTLKPTAGIDAAVTGEVSENVADATPADNKASQALKVVLPTIAFDPPLGPPGFVTTVRGTNFPKGAHVRLSWDFGIMSVTQDVVVGDDGTFVVPLLVFPRETPGARVLTATGVRGPRFRPATAPFTVVPGTEQPRDFVNRR